jgi:hypothetical protein
MASFIVVVHELVNYFEINIIPLSILNSIFTMMLPNNLAKIISNMVSNYYNHFSIYLPCRWYQNHYLNANSVASTVPQPTTVVVPQQPKVTTTTLRPQFNDSKYSNSLLKKMVLNNMIMLQQLQNLD